MGMMMAVSFKRAGRLHYLDPGEWRPAVGDKVLVPTQTGPEVAECIWAPQWIDDDIEGLPVCEGFATESDLARDESVRAKRAEAKLLARRLVREHDLPMKVVAADYVFATGLIVIYFGAPDRVDFRALARDLSGKLRTRVELRQVGPREEAKLQGGIGPCGRDLCCSTFLREFEPVSIRMAKDQDLPVNPMRIAGACGRLMCCLKYEHPLYVQFKERAPKVGSEVSSPDGEGTVVGYSVPADQVIVKVAETGQRCACPAASVCGSRQAYEATHGGAREGHADR
ncbi:MAG TPA: regulatory iron-sulfur-containing complex subunit RicT [Streptosporangiaceae bacterium]|jgi:cell fate regulator YaaT (PSP1 superfamily)|nr:regulatory iron-sulfur-containing complex subunit RicT [Streptosporangiaceae bacterium]